MVRINPKISTILWTGIGGGAALFLLTCLAPKEIELGSGVFFLFLVLFALAIAVFSFFPVLIVLSSRLSPGVKASAIFLFTLVFYLAAMTSDHNWGGDFAHYILQCIAIADDDLPGFLDLAHFWYRLPENPDRGIVMPVIAPWGLPLLLLPLYRLFGVNIGIFKLIGIVCVSGSAALMFLRYRDRLPGHLLGALLLLFILNPFLLNLANQVLTDLPFLFFCLSAIMLMEKSHDAESAAAGRRLTGVLLACCLAAACLCRSNGVLLFIPLFALLLGRLFPTRNGTAGAMPANTRLRLSAETLAVLAVTLLLLGAVHLPLPAGNTHLPSFVLRNLNASRILDYIYYYLFLPARFIPLPRVPARIIWLILAAFILLTAWRYRDRYRHLALWIGASFGMLVLVPFHDGLRYIAFLLPFLFGAALIGLAESDRLFAAVPWRKFRLSEAWGRRLPAALRLAACSGAALLPLAAAMYFTAARFPTPPGGAPFTPESREIFDYIRTHTPTDAKIFFFKPRVMALFTGRLSTLDDDLSRLRPEDYLVVRLRQRKRNLDSKEFAVRHRLTTVFRNEGFAVFRRLPETVEENAP